MASTPSRTALLAIVLVVLAVAGGLGGFVYYRGLGPAPATVRTVQLGDNVTVNYIGVMGSGAEAGKVFDTSIYAVANDPIAWPKTLEYSPRASPQNYTPLPVHVGGSTPSSGYALGNYSFIQVVTGFWQGLVGLAGNATRVLAVPPSLGYGPANPACLTTRPLTFTVPVLRTMSASAFSQTYPGVTAYAGSEFPDPTYGWPVLVLSQNASFVTVDNLAQVGMTAHPSGWTVAVTGVAATANGSGTITLTNELTPGDAGRILGVGGSGACASQSQGHFIVSAVDVGNGTFTENYNPEVQGETLDFLVTVVDIFAPVAA